MQFLACRAVFDQREFDHLHIAVVVEVSFLVPHISNTAAHAGGEVAPCTSENHHASSGHIFAAVVADPFQDSDSTGVAHAETFAYTSVDIYFATCRPVYQGVSGNRVVLGYESRPYRRHHADAPTTQAFA